MGNNKGSYERQVYITLSANFKELEKSLISNLTTHLETQKSKKKSSPKRITLKGVKDSL